MQDFESIYSEYFSDVFHYTRSLTLDESRAEDLTAETFLRAMRSLSSFRGECDIRIWLCRIAKNLYLTEQQKRNRFTKEPLSEELPDGTDFTESFADRETALELHRLLHRMEEPYKEVFSLRTFGEMSFSHIGELFGKSEHWACVTYHRAKEKLRTQFFQNKEDTDP